jgi:imidazolonepropionase-like amidohydrolase
VTEPHNRLLIVADRLIDGTGNPALGRSFVAIEGDRITAVGPVQDAGTLAPAPARRRDFPGCTILPRFVASHVHLTFGAGPVPFEELQTDSSSCAPRPTRGLPFRPA